jgi:hypothetical protein
MGQISWQEVRKLVMTTYCPASEPSVKLFPFASKRGRASTSAGIIDLRNVPPPTDAPVGSVFAVVVEAIWDPQPLRRRAAARPIRSALDFMYGC